MDYPNNVLKYNCVEKYERFVIIYHERNLLKTTRSIQNVI